MAPWKNGFLKKLQSTANLNFLFLSLFVCLLKNCSSQFFSNWKSAEPVFWSLPYKNQNKSITLSFWEGKFKFAVGWGLFIKPFFHCTGPPLKIRKISRFWNVWIADRRLQVLFCMKAAGIKLFTGLITCFKTILRRWKIEYYQSFVAALLGLQICT